jgi:hypothetical protein
MKAETIDCPAQHAQPAACDHLQVVGLERTIDDVEIAGELLDVVIGGSLSDRTTVGLDVELGGRCRKPRIDAGDR